MYMERKLTYGLTLTGLLGLAFLGWTHLYPASAQDDAAQPGQRPGPGRMMFGGMGPLAASGDFVYTVRGNTLFQLKAADLSMAAQKDLPLLAAAPAPPPNAPEADPQDAPPPGNAPRRFGMGPVSLAASGDFIYVSRGNTLYQFKAADLSVVTQKDLPAPAAPGPAPGAAGAPNNP